MSTQAILFYILGSAILIFGALTVFSRMIFRSAVYLLLSLIGMAGIYIMMEMNFIAALQIIIYVGGIVVLIIFSIFLTHQAGEKLPGQKPYYIAWAGSLSGIGLALTGWVVYHYHFSPAGIPSIEHSVRNVGLQMFDYKTHGYVLPFEIISILLLAALVGSIVIVMKDKTEENKNI